MKNRGSFRRVYIEVAILLATAMLSVNSYGQVFKNKLNAYVGYSVGSSQSNPFATNGSFKFPSLYANLSFTTVSLQGVYRFGKFLSVGGRIESVKGSGWSLKSEDVYKGAETSFMLLSPVIQIHNAFHEDGIFNRLKIYISIQPVIGNASTTIRYPLSDIQYDGIQLFETRLSDKGTVLGLSGSVGAEFSVNQRFGIYTAYAYRRQWLQSSLSMDEDLVLSNMEMGIFCRFLKNKRYYY